MPTANTSIKKVIISDTVKLLNVLERLGPTYEDNQRAVIVTTTSIKIKADSSKLPNLAIPEFSIMIECESKRPLLLFAEQLPFWGTANGNKRTVPQKGISLNLN